MASRQLLQHALARLRHGLLLQRVAARDATDAGLVQLDGAGPGLAVIQRFKELFFERAQGIVQLPEPLG